MIAAFSGGLFTSRWLSGRPGPSWQPNRESDSPAGDVLLTAAQRGAVRLQPVRAHKQCRSRTGWSRAEQATKSRVLSCGRADRGDRQAPSRTTAIVTLLLIGLVSYRVGRWIASNSGTLSPQTKADSSSDTRTHFAIAPPPRRKSKTNGLQIELFVSRPVGVKIGHQRKQLAALCRLTRSAVGAMRLLRGTDLPSKLQKRPQAPKRSPSGLTRTGPPGCRIGESEKGINREVITRYKRAALGEFQKRRKLNGKETPIGATLPNTIPLSLMRIFFEQPKESGRKT